MKPTLAAAIVAMITVVNAVASPIIDDDPSKKFDATLYTNRKVTINWITATNVQEACDAEIKKYGKKSFGYTLNACAFWDGDKCTIITAKTTSMHTLGHETRHCFQGAWH